MPHRRVLTHRPIPSIALICTLLATPQAMAGQTFATEDPVLQRIWHEGMERSRVEEMAQALLDSIGPRLTGSPGHEAGNQWLLETYGALGIEARTESYGTWLSWRRGRTHVDLVEPRVRTLDATALAWTPGTDGETVRGEVMVLPQVLGPEDFEAWLPSVEGRFVAISAPEPTCRPDPFLQAYASRASAGAVQAARAQALQDWNANVRRMGFDPESRRSLWPLAQRLEQAGAVGVLTSIWSQGWGVHRIFNGGTEEVPTLGLSCEDYGLVHRLTERGQGAVLEVMSESEYLGEGPVYNVIAEIPGAELPDEYVLLSAHFDSWDGGSGATDNGTGTVVMLEAMRILSTVYPNPRRTILVGHWGGEEQGLNGSRGFAQDHPEVVEGLQAMFNQDNGTFRVAEMSPSGLTAAAGSLARWLALVPAEITSQITFVAPGVPATGGSDHAALVCYGAPGFSLRSTSGDYSNYTWHTNRDTFDKVVIPEVRNNATLTAMLAYLAAEDPVKTPRDQRTVFGDDLEGWPDCEPARRSYDQRRR
jgi:hypothetical protein